MSQAQPVDNPRVVAHTYQQLPRFHLHTRNSKTSTTPTTPKPQNKKTSPISRIAESFT
jgi:hypothetical protein